MVRVRIAPSPTGNLHVGTARCALFNWLFARKNNGKFILRIEDTDLERSEERYVQNIFDSLKAIGLEWDEGPYKQSERLDLYKKYAEKLIESGHAYHFEGAIKFKMPSKIIKFNDLIKGELEFDTSLNADFVMIKSNGTPSYNFAVVIDDMEMQITHVIRGEDHISNTPKQIAIYEALGAELPIFGHMSMILAPDRTKLSKRHGATAVSEFIEQGYLPEAFVNFLALLGWSPTDNEEVKPIDKIVEQFDITRVSSSPAIFEFDKLNWMNGVYIRSLPLEDITERVKKYLTQYDLSAYSQVQLQTMVDAVRNNLVKLSDITEAVSYFFEDTIQVADLTEEDRKVLAQFKEFAEKIDYNNIEKIHEQLGEFREQMKPMKAKQVMPPIRKALTGRTHGADMGVVISLLGRERVMRRLSI
ncbi:MAG: hypothetical protein A2Y25_01395 [Candidatus Melainabacteria bacterium GWF2_37_15]|nr:MAG: hypothetical protein A2Y25_01395 [Candidatus Melainabacteria bacterium GWF2_37_15]